MLSTVPRSSVSAAIRAGTRSPYSHAAIYWGRLSFLEAIDVGVSNFNISRFGVSDLRNVRLLRLKGTVPNGRLIAERAAEAASSYIGREYTVWGAILSAIRTGAENAEGRVFCSYFVAQAYADAGLSLCAALEPWSITPGDLFRSDLIEDVTNSTLLALDESEAKGLTCVDGEHPRTPGADFREATNHVMVDVRRAFADLTLPTPKSLHDALKIAVLQYASNKSRNADAALAKILEGADYEHWPETILFPAGAPVASFLDTDMLRHLPIEHTERVLVQWHDMLENWVKRNSERKAGIDAGRRQYGTQFPLRILELQQRHETCHWKAMERAIGSLFAAIEQLEKERACRVSAK
jgi:hypothetical protein